MKMHNPANERIKRKYFSFLKEARRHSEPTIDAAAKALSRFEAYTWHNTDAPVLRADEAEICILLADSVFLWVCHYKYSMDRTQCQPDALGDPAMAACALPCGVWAVMRAFAVHQRVRNPSPAEMEERKRWHTYRARP